MPLLAAATNELAESSVSLYQYLGTPAEANFPEERPPPTNLKSLGHTFSFTGVESLLGQKA